MNDLFDIGFIPIGIADFIDIAIVTAIFYWIYKYLKDTVAIQILFGMIILLALSFFTEAIKLDSLHWILDTISKIWLIAFVVLFQPELRRLMLLITRNPLFRMFVKSKFSETIDEVIEAVSEMSAKHIGALIVFTRSQNVEMTVDTGIPLQAVVSQELLLSIFNTKSPLHDGAVIIQNQMAVAARCVLPLSSVTRYEGKNLGTRHRAALGLSNQVDAVILIVSEETGAVSIAEGGKLTLGIPKEQQPSVLRERLTKERKSSDYQEEAKVEAAP
jgi:diadenylate cyclase